MTHYNSSSSSTDSARGWLAAAEHAGGPRIVAMDTHRETRHKEAYYLFFVASLGMALNILVIAMIFVRRPLRRMTSAFVTHAAFLNFVKSLFCIFFGLNLMSDADETDEKQPKDCNMQGSGFIVIVTSSAVNMVAMICTEAYTFGEVNVGGNSHGTTCCIMFGLLVVYITSIILHLGPTLIGGDIVYNPDIGNCAFKLGDVTGYVANVMWISIITMSFVGVGHFLNKLYKEIQLNRPNRVSMLVRHSITISDDPSRKPSSTTVGEMVEEAMHRAKIFVITSVAFVLCWYPLFLLILIDKDFRVSPKVYQAFCFIAWTQALVEPIILIFFDRNINLLARYMYCDRDRYTASQIAYLMSRARHEEAATSHNASIELMMANDAGPNADAIPLTSLSREHSDQHAFVPLQTHCRHCSPTSIQSSSAGETTPLRPMSRSRSIQTSSPQTSSTAELRSAGVNHEPLAFVDHNHFHQTNYTPMRVTCDPIQQKEEEFEEDVQC